jgi:2-phospho-L-lactate guanylyltransferase
MPVKSFATAKSRLSSILSPEERALLMRYMAAKVISAAKPLQVFTVCDDPEVAEWASAQGTEISWTPGIGLNGAVQQTFQMLRQLGATRTVVVHADLPLITDLTGMAFQTGIAIAPNRERDGTNVISLPAEVDFCFSYGKGSFTRHLAQAESLGMPVHVFVEESLSFDLDTPEDYLALQASGGLPW